jgi:hypothetical protein
MPDSSRWSRRTCHQFTPAVNIRLPRSQPPHASHLDALCSTLDSLPRSRCQSPASSSCQPPAPSRQPPAPSPVTETSASPARAPSPHP